MSRMHMALLLCLAGLACSNSAFSQLNYSNETEVADYVRQMLYWEDALQTNKNIAAFRYKVLLYTHDGTNVLANTADIDEKYDVAAEERSKYAELHLQYGLTNNPSSPLLCDLLVDIYYDRAVAQGLKAQNAYAAADLIPFGIPPDPPDFVIDVQIPAYESVAQHYEDALTTYLSLLTNHLGLSSYPEPPMGFQLFKQLVPGRELNPARYITNEVPVSVIDDTGPLFSGYKDLVLLYGLLRDYGRTANSLAQLYIARGSPTDLSAAKELITDAQRFIFLHGSFLRGIFDPLDLDFSDSASGLSESQAGWELALSELDLHRQFIEGEANVLGFAPDFLMLIGKQSGSFDSFDSFKSLLDPGNESSRLQLAIDAFDDAITAEMNYHGYQEELQSELEDITGSAGDRLSEIIGAYPYPDGDDTPLQGSEAWLQQNSIEIATLQIQRNEVDISNLKEEIQTEIDRRGQEQGINNAISLVQIDYGNQQAGLTESIGHIEAAQKLCDAAAEAANADWEKPWGAVADVANGVAQAVAEEKKGQLQADKERLAGQESADITSLNDDLLDVNSKASIKKLWLRMNTHLIDSQEAALLLTQEQGRLVALAREKEQLEASIAESDASLAGRYFADPSHRLRLQSKQVLANLYFAEARKWLFFMSRALEYKWNRPFANYNYLDYTWSSSSLFKLRNADELNRFYQAMAAFDLPLTQSLIPDDRFDWFSVRENFFGYRRYNTNGAPLMYIDQPTGQMMTAVEAFRHRLQRLADSDPQGKVRLKFSTVQEIKGTTFFQGPDYLPDGSVDSALKGTYLDKIRWLKIRLPGQHSTTNFPQTANKITGSLTYGGTGYLRNRTPGVRDLLRPDRIVNEMTPHSTRFWSPGDNDPNEWQFAENQIESISILKANSNEQRLDGSSSQIDVLPSVQQIDTFAERSVAATGWELVIPTGPDLLSIGELDDIEIYFYHWAFSRN